MIRDTILKIAYMNASIIGSKISKAYNGPMYEIVRDHGHDVALPVFFYFGTKLTESVCRRSSDSRETIPPIFTALFGFLGCSAFECAQGLGLYKGTFDPKDFFAYALGVGLALTLDKLTIEENKPKNLVEFFTGN